MPRKIQWAGGRCLEQLAHLIKTSAGGARTFIVEKILFREMMLNMSSCKLSSRDLQRAAFSHNGRW